MASSKIVLRPARMDDFQAVMEIDTSVYGGLDYLGDLYAWTVQASECLALVGTADGKVVFYSFTVVLPGSTSMYSGGGRLAKTHRGANIMEIRDNITKLAKAKYPGLVHHLQLTLSSEARDQRLKRHTDNTYALRMEDKWDVEISLFTKEVLERSMSYAALSERPQHVRSITPTEVQKLMPQIIRILSNGRNFFSHGAYLLPSEITQDNVRYASRHCNVIGSFAGESSEKITSFSFSDFVMNQSGCTGVIQYYGTSTDQCIEQVKYFFQLYNKRVDDVYPGKLCSIVHVRRPVDYQRVREFICSHFGESAKIPNYTTSNGADMMLEVEKI